MMDEPTTSRMEKWEMYNRSKNLSELLQVLVTPSTKLEIQKLLDRGVFPNISEFGRFAIRTYLDKYYEIRRWEGKIK